MIRIPKPVFILSFCFFFFSCSLHQKKLGNVYRFVSVAKIKGFDPALSDDLYSVIAIKQVYETLLQYHHLKRPYQLTPLLADSMPRISSDGLTYTFTLKKDVHFQSDPCFKGGPRELTADDVIFSIKRLADIKVKSTGWWIFDGRIEGLNAFREKSINSLQTDYSLPVSGLAAPDPHTLTVRLTSPCPQFSYFFAMQFTSVVPREAVTFYGEEFLNHPVGSGPFKLVEWRRGLRLTYAKSPEYREEFYPDAGSPGDLEAGMLEDAGIKLPFIDTLIINIFVEDQPMWLNFIRGRIDVSAIPKDNFNRAVDPDLSLNPKLKDKGIVLSMNPMLDLTYTAFNMEDSLLGKNAHLRRAVCHAWNVQKVIDLFYNGRAVMAQSPIPPGLLGYDSTFKNSNQVFDTSLARKELSLAGFPGGKGLPPFRYLTVESTVSRQWSEKFVKEMGDVGMTIKVDMVTWPEFLKRLKTKNYQIAGSAWGADYPDPENFLQLLYGPNESPGTNNANYKNAEYDGLYRRLLLCRSDGEKLKIVQRMKEIFVEDCPWMVETHRLSFGLHYDWVKNLKYNDISSGDFKYIRVDVPLRNRRLSEDL